jgi:hypothetical protein
MNVSSPCFLSFFPDIAGETKRRPTAAGFNGA